MIYLGGQTGFTADAKRLFDSLNQLIAFAPHVHRVLALILRRDLAEFDQLLCLCEERRRIDESGGNAERARFHLASHELTHLLELGRRRWFVVEADDVLANGGRADE